jgi:hypothetical protein
MRGQNHFKNAWRQNSIKNAISLNLFFMKDLYKLFPFARFFVNFAVDGGASG